jgi:hypothetical protein
MYRGGFLIRARMPFCYCSVRPSVNRHHVGSELMTGRYQCDVMPLGCQVSGQTMVFEGGWLNHGLNFIKKVTIFRMRSG